MTRAEQDSAGSAEALSAKLGFSETIVEVGMTHPGLRRVLEGVGGTLGFLVTLDDERIRDLEVEIGLGHRGFEKEVESRGWLLALPYVRRLGLVGGLAAELAYGLALEALSGLETPIRAVWLRMLGAELARIADHFTRLAAISAAIELPAAEGLADRGAREATALLMRMTGVGALDSWIVPGGVVAAHEPVFEEAWPSGRDRLDRILARFETVAVRNPTCVARLRDVATLSPSEASSWSVTGPALRASGTPRDLRRDEPYLAYHELDFEVPIGESGDGYDRLQVVVEEIRQSLGLVEQCRARLEELPPGAIRVADPPWRWLASGASERASTSEDAPPGWEEVVRQGPSVPPGEAWARVEASTGELGFLLVSDGSGLPRRIRCRAPSFFHAQVLPRMLRGARLDDLMPTVASMHVVSTECDR